MTRLFRKSACRLLPAEIPTRARDLNDPRDPDVTRVSSAVRKHEAHLGLLIDDDAQRCAFFDNTGACIDPKRVLQLLAQRERETFPNGRIIWEGTDCNPRGSPAAGEKIGEGTLAGMSQALRVPGAVCGADATGRFWFVESYPVCDAVLTLVKLLHVLSQSDTPFAELIRAESTAA